MNNKNNNLKIEELNKLLEKKDKKIKKLLKENKKKSKKIKQLEKDINLYIINNKIMTDIIRYDIELFNMKKDNQKSMCLYNDINYDLTDDNNNERKIKKLYPEIKKNKKKNYYPYIGLEKIKIIKESDID